MPRRGPTIADTARALIEERGPLTLEELAVEMVALERTRAKDPVAAVRSAIDANRRFLEGRDGRWYSLTKQLEGAVFTVAPTALERDNGIVLVREDLDLVRRVIMRFGWIDRGEHDKGIHLDFFGSYFGLPWRGDWIAGYDEDGYPIRDEAWDLSAIVGEPLANQLLRFLDEVGVERDDDEAALLDLIDEMTMTEVIHGPDGWMPALRPRELLAIEIHDGELRVAAIDKRATKGMHVEAAAVQVGRIARGILDEEEGLGAPAVPIAALLEIIATEAPEVFHRPLPPIARLLEQAGLEVDSGLVGLPGAAWDDIRWALDPDPEAAWGYEPGDAIN